MVASTGIFLCGGRDKEDVSRSEEVTFSREDLCHEVLSLSEPHEGRGAPERMSCLVTHEYRLMLGEVRSGILELSGCDRYKEMSSTGMSWKRAAPAKVCSG